MQELKGFGRLGGNGIYDKTCIRYVITLIALPRSIATDQGHIQDEMGSKTKD